MSRVSMGQYKFFNGIRPNSTLEMVGLWAEISIRLHGRPFSIGDALHQTTPPLSRDIGNQRVSWQTALHTKPRVVE